MGLDMNAYTVPQEVVGDLEVDMDYTGAEFLEIAYWRKFNSLHGWMADLYKLKGGEDLDFNCRGLRLMPEDLERLELCALNKTLKPRAGFFFGNDLPFSDEDKQRVLDFVFKARRAIDDGQAVIYCANY